MYIKSSGHFFWYKTYNTAYDMVAVAKFNPTADKIVAVLSMSDFRFAFIVI